MATGLRLLLRLSSHPRLLVPPLFSSAASDKIQASWQRRSVASSMADSSSFLYTKPGIEAKIIDGKKIAKAVRAEIANEVSQLVSSGKRPPSLSVVLVGDDKASRIFVNNKMRAAVECGLKADLIQRTSKVTEEELLEITDGLKRDEEVDGMLVQLPVPPHINEKIVRNAVCPDKDVDGFHNTNIGHFCSGEPRLVPATPLGVLEILKRLHVPTFGKNVCIVNRSKNIGLTLAALLHSNGTGDATITICHRHTPPMDLSVMTRMADIVIVATGIPGLIRGDMVKEGATVIDIGITRLDNKIVGDVDFVKVGQVARYLTPVPGGVGPLTVAMVIKNTVRAALKDYCFDFASIQELMEEERKEEEEEE